MDSQFDAFVRVYENDEYMPFRRYVEAHSFFRALGDVAGRSVLDIGCGAGLYTRQLKERGASRVVGLDSAAAMVEYARERAARDGQDIEYVVDDATNAATHGTFDVVTAIYVLPYADSVEKLLGMCRAIYDALAPGGRLVAMPLSPTVRYSPPDFYKNYGFTLHSDDPAMQDTHPLSDLTPIRLRSLVPELPLDVVAYHWSADAQQRIFWQAGFARVTWHRPELAPDGIARYGADFWADYLEYPHSAPVVCQK